MTVDACLVNPMTPAPPAVGHPRRSAVRPADPPYDDDAAPSPAFTTVSVMAARRPAPASSHDLPAGAEALPPPLRIAYLAGTTARPPRSDPGFVPSQREPVASAGSDGRFHPAPLPAAVVVVRAIVEALSGIRPAAQLATWTTPKLQADLERRAPRPGTTRRGSVRSVRVSEPRAGIAEVCAVIARGSRIGALALRMESTDGRWRVTTLQIG